MASSSRSRQSSKRSRSESEPPPRMPADTMGIRFNNDEERRIFVRLHNRAHLVTKFAYVETLRSLGLFNGVHTLLANGGLEDFLWKSALTYPRITTEFLCTLHAHETEPPSISFRLFGRSYSLTYPEIGEAFGWKFPTQQWEQPDASTLACFWTASTNHPYQTEANKVYMISHPALRYVYRLLSMTLFLRGEPSGISLGELGCLYALLHPNISHPDWVSFFVGKCLYMQGSRAGKLGFGGMITLLALKANVHIPANCEALMTRSTNLYDLTGLRVTKFITVVNDQIYYVINGDERGTMLPHPQRGYFDIAPTDTPHQLYMRGQMMDAASPGEELPEDAPEEPILEDEDDDYVPDEEEERRAQPTDTTDHHSWQQQMSARMTTLEESVQGLNDRFQAYEQRSYREMYDISTHLQALRMQISRSSIAGPSEDVQAFEAQRHAARPTNIVYTRRGSRRSSARDGPPEGQ